MRLYESIIKNLKEAETPNYKQMFIDYCKGKISKQLGYSVYYGFLDPDDGDNAKEYIRVKEYNVDYIDKDGDYLGLHDIGNMDYSLFVLDKRAGKKNSEKRPYTYTNEEDGPASLGRPWAYTDSEYVSELSFQKISQRAYDDFLEYWDDIDMDGIFEETMEERKEE